MLLTEIPRYLTIEQAAELLHLHPDTVRRFLRQKRLPGKKVGHEWRISSEALDNFMQSREADNGEAGRGSGMNNMMLTWGHYRPGVTTPHD